MSVYRAFYPQCIMLSEDFVCVHSPSWLPSVFHRCSSNSSSESLNSALFLDKSIPKFEFLSGGSCLAVLSNGNVFCLWTQPRLMLLWVHFWKKLQYVTVLPLNLFNKRIFKAYGFCSLHYPLCSSPALVVQGHTSKCSSSIFVKGLHSILRSLARVH